PAPARAEIILKKLGHALCSTAPFASVTPQPPSRHPHAGVQPSSAASSGWLAQWRWSGKNPLSDSREFLPPFPQDGVETIQKPSAPLRPGREPLQTFLPAIRQSCRTAIYVPA